MASPKDNANKKTKIILSKILEECELGTLRNGDIKLGTKHFLSETGVDNNQFIAILETLKNRAVIKDFLVHRNAYEDDKPGEPDLICFIKISHLFKARAEDYVETFSKDEPIEKTTSGSIIYLTESGDLWHGENKEFCYEMRSSKRRIALLRYLIKHKGYQTTRSIAMAFDMKVGQTSDTINKMRMQISNHLDISDLIENSPGPGYRVNPKYQIKETK
jgi:hypothetical protein